MPATTNRPDIMTGNNAKGILIAKAIEEIIPAIEKIIPNMPKTFFVLLVISSFITLIVYNTFFFNFANIANLHETFSQFYLGKA